MWGAAKVVIRRKGTGLNAYTRKVEWFNICNLSFYLQKLGKNRSRGKEYSNYKGNITTEAIEQWSPTFSAPGTGAPVGT